MIPFLGSKVMECTKNPYPFCIVAHLKDIYFMIAGNVEGCKELVVHEE